MSDPKKTVREKSHRLPREAYQGEVMVALTMCVGSRYRLFAAPEVVHVFLNALGRCAAANKCVVALYCFMPDHLHLILQGQSASADAWRAATSFKQRTGFWLSKHMPTVSWQKDFHDHLIGRNEDLGAQARYIAGNPVRKGLVRHWEDYLFTGSIGVELKTVLESVSTL